MKNRVFKFFIALALCFGMASSAIAQRPTTEINLGSVTHKSTRDTIIHIKAQDGPMWIQNVKVSCNCLKISHKKSIVMAGDSVELKVRFSADDKGVFYKTANVVCSDSRASVSLVFRGRVI